LSTGIGAPFNRVIGCWVLPVLLVLLAGGPARAEVVSGRYLGDGVADRKISGLGFQPDAVFLKGDSDRSAVLWTSTMGEGNSKSFTEPSGFLTDAIISSTEDGFTLGSGPEVNEAGVYYDWIAFAAVPGELVVGSYVGDGQVYRTVSGLGLDPSYVIVASEGASHPWQRSTAMPPLQSLPFGIKGLSENLILALEKDGFVIGSDPAVNAAGTTFHYLAWALTPGRVGVGYYPGNGVDGTEFHVRAPEYLLIKGGADVGGAHRCAGGVTGDSTLNFIPEANFENGIQVFENELIQLGNDLRVNGLGINYYFFAIFADSAQVADLQVIKEVAEPNPAEGDTVVFTVEVANLGPGFGRGIELTDKLPGGLTFISGLPTAGTYDPGSGIWTLGNLASGGRDTLALIVEVAAGYADSTIVNWAGVTASEVSDPDPTNNSDSAEITVGAPPGNPSADLRLVKVVDDPVASEGDTVRFSVCLHNDGPEDATGVEVTDEVPAGVTFLAAVASAGTYDGESGVWSVGATAAGDSATLGLAVTVDPGSAGQVITNTATVTASAPPDSVAENDTASAQVTIASVDLQVTKEVDDPTVSVGDTVNFSVKVTNAGPLAATGIEVTDELPTRLTFLAATPDQGDYDVGTGVWTVGTLAPAGQANLILTARVDSGGFGSWIVNTAAVTVVDQVDGDPGNDSDSASVTIVLQPVPAGAMIIRTVPVDTISTLEIGGPPEPALILELINQSLAPDTLTSLTLTNITAGPGSPEQLDADWSQVLLFVDQPGPSSDLEQIDFLEPGSGQFDGGAITWDGISLPIANGDTLRLVVKGSASLAARDGDVMAATVNSAQDVGVAYRFAPGVSWPLDPQTYLAADGFGPDQLEVRDVPAGTFGVGSTGNLAFDALLPANGYETDVLNQLRVVNNGDTDPPPIGSGGITSVDAWADSAGGTYEPGTENWLGSLVWIGDRWALSGLSEPVPLEGLRLYITVDIALEAAGNTIQLGLPAGDDPGVRMASGNDGPTGDDDVFNAFAQTISTEDRVVLTTSWIAPGTVNPGATEALILHLVAQNAYPGEWRTLTDLTVTNTTSGPGGTSQADLDGETEHLQLWLDSDENGQFDPEIDTAFREGSFVGGTVSFSGLDWQLPPDPGIWTHLFCTADVSLLGAADLDTISAQIADPNDLTFDVPTALAADWPLSGGPGWRVDGMVAEQIGNVAVPEGSLAGGYGPALAFEVIIPANGYQEDTLTGLDLQNEGTATEADIDSLHVWYDNGDGVFDAGPPDVSVGPLGWVGTIWRSGLWNMPVPVQGRRLFVGLWVADEPTDSTTVRLKIPTGGVTVASQNDGPVGEGEVVSRTTLLLSTSPLHATVQIVEPVSTVGQQVTVRMVVRNDGSETMLGVAPADTLVPDVEGILVAAGAAQPDSVVLLPAEQDTFTWTYFAAGPGEVRLSGSAVGRGETSQDWRSSAPHQSASHQVLNPVSHLDLFPVTNMPFSINRGQQDVVPLTLTLENPGGTTVADARLDWLKIRLEDEDGHDIAPASLLSRVVVSEGPDVYLEKPDSLLETTGGEIDLSLDLPAVITGSEQVTLGLRMDISDSTQVENFRVVISDSTWFEAYDDVSGDPVPLILQGGSYPIESGLGRLVAEATGLNVTLGPMAEQSVGQGQPEVDLLVLELENPGLDELSSAVEVGALSVVLEDAQGEPLPDPELLLAQIGVRGPFQVHTQRAVTVEDDTTLVLFLSPPLSVPVDTPVELVVFGDVLASAPILTFRTRLGPETDFDARDANTGSSVPVFYEPAVIVGADIMVEAPATDLSARVEGVLPATLTIGALEVTALTARLRHSGGQGTASIRVDSLSVLCRDAEQNPLQPAAFIDRLGVKDGDLTYGELGDPVGVGGRMSVPLTGLVLAPGDTVELALVLDVQTSAPVYQLELVLEENGILAVDANLETQVALTAEGGGDFPFTSGLTLLQVPADELVVGFTDRMPAVLAAQPQQVPVALLSLGNPAAEEAGDITVDGMGILAADQNLGPLPIGATAAEVAAYVAGELWATSGQLGDQDTLAILEPVAELEVAPGQTVEVDLRVSFRPDAASGSFRIGLAQDGISVVQPDGALLAIRVEPAEGGVFPFWTLPGNFTGLTLGESYANFPNPFAAGRELTTFVYSLHSAATVSLRILTPHGEAVCTILNEQPRGQGVHQDDVWDGRNGRGVAVRNGVYLAELVVNFNGGSSERLLRKVAVVR